MSEARPSHNYPTSYGAISGWAQQNGVGVAEARRRFAQYAILRGIASSASLRELLVFKGGNALDFIWDPNRSTLDLDFSVDMSMLENRDLVEVGLEALLSRGLAVSARDVGVRFGVHSVRRQPPGEGKTFVTYTARIGYALPDDSHSPRSRGTPDAPCRGGPSALRNSSIVQGRGGILYRGPPRPSWGLLGGSQATFGADLRLPGADMAYRVRISMDNTN